MKTMCALCKSMRNDWMREKMQALVDSAREKAIELGSTVAIIKESALDYQIVGLDEINGKNVIQYVTTGD